MSFHLKVTENQWRRSVINLGGPGHLFPSFNPPFFSSLSWTSQRVWAEPAHPLPNILMQFIQSNSLAKSTLMLNVLQKSPYMQSSAAVDRTGFHCTCSSTAVKSGGLWHYLSHSAFHPPGVSESSTGLSRWGYDGVFSLVSGQQCDPPYPIHPEIHSPQAKAFNDGWRKVVVFGLEVYVGNGASEDQGNY